MKLHRRLLRLSKDRIFYGILISTQFSIGSFDYFYCKCFSRYTHHLKLVHHRSQLFLNRLGSDIMRELQFLNRHHGPTGMLLRRMLINSTRTYLIFHISTFIGNECFEAGRIDKNQIYDLFDFA